MYKLTKEGKKYLTEKELPEKQLVKKLQEEPRSIEELKKELNNLDIAVNWGKRKGLIEIEQGKVKLLKEPSSYPEEEALKLIKEDKEKKVNSEEIQRLLERKLVKEIREDVVKKAKNQIKGKGQITHLTPELIQTELWKEAKFKEYNIKALGKKKHPGKKHILTHYVNKIRRIFLDMGFQEKTGPYVESSFWNFDALYTAQDHPVREMQDTFFTKKPEKAELPDKNTVKNVKKMHEEGYEDSKGWGYEWSEEEAKRPVLRTHTTSLTIKALKEIETPAKIFSIGRVFRNETIDYSHIPEFAQVEGIVAAEEMNFKNLLGYLEEFYNRMGFEKVRFRPGYFPYTEMSVEPEVYYEPKEEWLEMGGSGIFRPEVTRPMGIDVPVLAWGLGLERIAMLDPDVMDIRDFYCNNDLELLRNKQIKLE